MESRREDKHYSLPDYSGQVITHAPIGIIVTDEYGIIQQANPKAAILCGAPAPEALIGQALHPVPGGKESKPLDLMKIMRSAGPVSTRTFERTPFGAELKCDCTFVPLLTESGSPKGLLILLLDVREKLLLESQLFQQEKLSALDTIVSGVAHELNNPLTAILGYTEYLLSRDIDPDTRKYLSSIIEASQRCSAIVNSLRAFAQRQRTPKTLNSINDILEEMVALCAYQLRIDHIDLTLELDPALPIIHLQVREMQRVFLSIISNAQYALNLVDNRPRTLRIHTLANGPNINIVFEDNGIGMNQEVRNRVFDPFYTGRPQGEGIGMGLSVAHGVIRAHEGTITLESEPDQGTTLTISLPIRANDEDALPTAP